jgi:hypothetical protein
MASQQPFHVDPMFVEKPKTMEELWGDIERLWNELARTLFPPSPLAASLRPIGRRAQQQLLALPPCE